MMSQLLLGASKKQATSTVDMVDPFVDGSGVALYKFDGDATDRGGTYNGTASNVTYGTGKFGQCVQSTVSSSNVSFGVHQFNVPKTLSFWAKGSVVVENGQNNKQYPTIKFMPTSFRLFNGTNTVINLPLSYDTSVFVHICVTINYPSVVVYINGVMANSGSMSNQAGTTPFDFGLWDVPEYNETLNGSIDQFRIFNRAITQAEVTALYNESYTPRVYTDFFADNSEILNLKFDGDATDSSGTYDGSATGVTYITGKIGQCAVFNGTNTYDGFIEIASPNVSFVNLGAKAPELFSEYSGKPRTYSAWVALSSSTDAFVLNYGNLDNQTSPYYFKICFTPTLFHVRTQSYQPNNTFIGKETNTTHNTIINYGTFYHIAFVFPSDSTGIIKFYINGDFVGQATHTVWSSLSSSYDVWLQKFTGNVGNGYAAHYVGCKIDSLRVFNRALTDTEVTALYNEGV